MADYDFQFGAIKVDGSKDHGSSGWRSRALGVGKYEISFTNRFENTPSISVTPENSDTPGGTLRSPLVPEVVITSDRERRRVMRVNLRMANGILSSGQFNFIAIAAD